jgi:hypothetical protein
LAEDAGIDVPRRQLVGIEGTRSYCSIDLTGTGINVSHI